MSAFGSRREKPRGERRSATGHTTATSGEQLKRSADQTPCKVALALRCEVSELFDNYEAARLHFSSREARKLTEEDRRSYAENNIGLVRFFVNSYLSLWDGDFDEGFSEALECFFKALVDFRKPEKEKKRKQRSGHI